MSSREEKWDRMLGIKTSGRDDTGSDQFRYPYEPTPYCVLERLAFSGLIGKKNVLIDYGCGKGRVGFFLSYQTRCRTVGVEYNERILSAAFRNKEAALRAHLTDFVLQSAESYQVPSQADRFYFFNPFSLEILQSVLERIKESWYQAPREMLLFFYYPSDEYVVWLMTVRELSFADEIDCEDLFDGENSRERILVFSLG